MFQLQEEWVMDEKDWCVSKRYKGIVVLFVDASVKEEDQGIAIFTVDDFLKFFEDEVDDIRRKTEGAVEPT